MNQNQVVKTLEEVLASSYGLLIKTQNYHWNVSGPNFKPLHELFETQYRDLFEVVDEFAERIRAFGIKVEASFEHFSKLNKAKKGNENLSADEMLQDLALDNQALIKTLKEGIEIAQKNGDEGTADIFIQRVKIHEKALWMIEASKTK
jgi:starvation-inducible DNA-binding protein